MHINTHQTVYGLTNQTKLNQSGERSLDNVRKSQERAIAAGRKFKSTVEKVSHRDMMHLFNIKA